jgi:hypothetical protein
MRNSDNLLPSRLNKRRQSKLEVRLNQSLRYRSAHKVQAAEIPDETSEKYFHPERQGLFCDAPLGLKY